MMEIEPIAGLTVVDLPDGKKAIVQVAIAGPKTAARIAKALTAQAKPKRGTPA